MPLFPRAAIRLGSDEEPEPNTSSSRFSSIPRFLNPSFTPWRLSGAGLYVLLQLLFFGLWFLGQFISLIICFFPPFQLDLLPFSIVKIVLGGGFFAIAVLLFRLHHSPSGSQLTSPPYSHLLGLVAIASPIVWSFLTLIEVIAHSSSWYYKDWRRVVFEMIDASFFFGGLGWLVLSVVAAVVAGLKWICGGEGGGEGYTEVAREEGNLEEEVW